MREFIKRRGLARQSLVVMTALAAFLSVTGCKDLSGPRERVMTLDVASSRVACQGAFPQECFRVRVQPDVNWTLFYDSIDGFNYEPGFEYTIRVAERPVPNPMQDGSSVAYRLLSILRKMAA